MIFLIKIENNCFSLNIIRMEFIEKEVSGLQKAVREKTRNVGSSCADIDPMTIDK